jgi:hypothetical protein
MEQTIEVPNPLRELVPQLRTVRGALAYHEDRVRAQRSLRDDPLARMHQRKQINGAQYQAGRDLQRLLEDAEIGKLGSPDYSQEPVDGGNRVPEIVTEKQRRAVKDLMPIWPKLGQEGTSILRDFLVDRLDCSLMALKRGEAPTKRAQLYFGRRVRECLTTMARHFKLA